MPNGSPNYRFGLATRPRFWREEYGAKPEYMADRQSASVAGPASPQNGPTTWPGCERSPWASSRPATKKYAVYQLFRYLPLVWRPTPPYYCGERGGWPGPCLFFQTHQRVSQ